MNPRISVIMAVYNGEKYLKESIDSILCQTFNNFEFIIINDNSTDKTEKIIESYNDPRILLKKNDINLGLSASLNIGIKLAKGEFIARMDADDISLPQRFEKQLNFLDNNPEIALCGTNIIKFNNNKKIQEKFPTNPEEIKCGLLLSNPFAHPSVMIRKSIFDKYNLSYPQYKNAQDFALWAEIAKYEKMSNLDEFLLLYRLHSLQTSKNNKQQVFEEVVLKQYKNINFVPAQEELELNFLINRKKYSNNKEFLIKVNKFFSKIIKYNSKNPYYSEEVLSKVLGQRYYEICLNTAQEGLWSWQLYLQNSINYKFNPTFSEKMIFLCKQILGILNPYNSIKSLYNKIRNKDKINNYEQ